MTKEPEITELDKFKKELDVLLAKYGDLPEITLTIRPRVSIEVAKPPAFVVPKTFTKEDTMKVSVPGVVVSSDPIDKGLVEEKGINPGLIANLSKFTQIE